jgi:hypothetical protein
MKFIVPVGFFRYPKMQDFFKNLSWDKCDTVEKQIEFAKLLSQSIHDANTELHLQDFLSEAIQQKAKEKLYTKHGDLNSGFENLAIVFSMICRLDIPVTSDFDLVLNQFQKLLSKNTLRVQQSHTELERSLTIVRESSASAVFGAEFSIMSTPGHSMVELISVFRDDDIHTKQSMPKLSKEKLETLDALHAFDVQLLAVASDVVPDKTSKHLDDYQEKKKHDRSAK